jgi:hypothetical protein
MSERRKPMDELQEECEPKREQESCDSNTMETFLQRLSHIVRARRRFSANMKIFYLVLFSGWLAGIVYLFVAFFSQLLADMTNGNHIDLTKMFYIILMSLGGFGIIGLNYLANTVFYNRHAHTLREVVLPLARSGDEKAVVALLDVIDGSTAGALDWGQFRPLFFEAISLVAQAMTPDRFQRLTAPQMKLLALSIRSADPTQRLTIREMLVRCGDARALRFLLRHLALNLRAMKSPKSKWVSSWTNWLYDHGGTQRLDETVIVLLTECCNAMQVRIEEENRNAQLLRASDDSVMRNASQLVRPSSPNTTDLRPEELVRATDVPPVTVVADATAVVEMHAISVAQPEIEKSTVQQTRL